MNETKTQFIEFLIEQQALRFGAFTLKSGRVSPYFFNLGVFNTGESLAKLGQYYADTLIASNLQYDLLFGPAYKGIPLVSSASIALYEHHNQNTPYCFNRKVAKSYGDGGELVGAGLTGQVVMLDDVITAGTTVKETIALMQKYDATFAGIVIAFDREERGEESTASAVQTVTTQYHIPVVSIVTLSDVIAYLSAQSKYAAELAAIRDYQNTYGV